jgi:hypothetical protein
MQTRVAQNQQARYVLSSLLDEPYQLQATGDYVF